MTAERPVKPHGTPVPRTPPRHHQLLFLRFPLLHWHDPHVDWVIWCILELEALYPPSPKDYASIDLSSFPHRPYNCAINLLPGTTLPKGCLYPCPTFGENSDRNWNGAPYTLHRGHHLLVRQAGLGQICPQHPALCLHRTVPLPGCLQHKKGKSMTMQSFRLLRYIWSLPYSWDFVWPVVLSKGIITTLLLLWTGSCCNILIYYSYILNIEYYYIKYTFI